MPDYKITTGLPQVPAGMEEKDFGKFLPIYNSMNALAQAVSIASGSVDFSQAELAQRNQLGSLQAQNHRKLYALADGVSLAYGAVVNLYLSSGKIAAQLADASSSAKPAHGIVNAPLGIAAGEFGEIMFIEGYSQGIAGTTFGAPYYLSTGGLVQLARPSAVGTIEQAVGWGLGSAGFYLHISTYFVQH